MSCSNGSCSSESLGCSIGDTVNPSHRFGVTGPAGQPTVAGSCLLPPGFDNCLSYGGNLAPCDVAKIQRTRRRFVVAGSTIDDTLTDQTAVLSPQLSTPAGYTWWRVGVPAIGVSHQLCPREFTASTTGILGTTDLTDQILEVAVQGEFIYEDGDGNFVHGVEWPKPADPDDLRILDGRCACERLCQCTTYFARVGIDLLIPTQDPLNRVDVVVKGVRDCWQISCGSCPPAKLCGREIIVEE